MNLTQPVDVLQFEDITKEFFLNNYIKPGKPAVIKGLLNHCKAGELWTLERMIARLGEHPIDVFDNKKRNGTSFIFANETIPMKEMFDLITNNRSSDYRMFVNPVLKKDKALSDELPIPSFFTGNLQLSNLLFLGGKDCVVPLHFDFMKDDGLLTQFYGRKDVILVSQDQSDLLYRLPFNTTSLANLFAPDYEKFPALKKVVGSKVRLEHGDTLYIPAGTWHQIKYVDASMSVAFRRWNKNPAVTVKTMLLRFMQIPFDKSIQALLGKRWLERKKKNAKMRAERRYQEV